MSQQGKRKTRRLLDFQSRPVTSLGHRDANSFLRGDNFFNYSMYNTFKIHPTHFS